VTQKKKRNFVEAINRMAGAEDNKGICGRKVKIDAAHGRDRGARPKGGM